MTRPYTLPHVLKIDLTPTVDPKGKFIGVTLGMFVPAEYLIDIPDAELREHAMEARRQAILKSAERGRHK